MDFANFLTLVRANLGCREFEYGLMEDDDLGERLLQGSHA